MKTAIITNSSVYQERAELIGRCLQKDGDQVTWYCTDFNHRSKTREVIDLPDHVAVRTIEYSRNISPARLLSSLRFAKDTEKLLQDEDYDLLYFLVPANSLCRAAQHLKRKNPKVKIVFDLLDLWPESLPIRRISWTFPIRYWRSLRDHNIGCADHIFTECNLYRQLLHMNGENTSVLYWCGKEPLEIPEKTYTEGAPLQLLYLGSISNIIDIPAIIDLLHALQKKTEVCLHVIGAGEKCDAFIQNLNDAGIPNVYHGAVYEDQKKYELTQPCSFGLNIMKTDVKVGLTMKSIDYLRYTLPLINSIQGDSTALVEEYHAGVNIDRQHLDETADRILEMQRNITEAQQNAAKVYREKLTQKAFERALIEDLKKAGIR